MISHRTTRTAPVFAAVRRRECRRGSVLVVVLALLSALMLLGFLFFTIASQERENARYFTASEKWYSAQLSADELFDFAMEQVIVGPQDDLPNSALWGGRFSLLANLVGDDLQPYSGRGVPITDAGGTTPNGIPAVDLVAPVGPDTPLDTTGGTGAPDMIDDRLSLDLAGIAALTGSAWDLRTAYGAGTAPDVPYSYPDLNSPFLAYVGTEPMTGNRVIIPSFHRPQYLRGLFTGTAVPPGRQVPPDQWYTNPLTQPYVMRPHATRNAKVFNYSNTAAGGLIVDTGIPRFVEPTLTDGLQEGYWSLTAAGTPTDNFDADPDNDGVNEAVWLDLDHPIEETPDGTEKFIPLFAISVYDLDGLLNVNAHGNAYGTPTTLASLPAGVAGDPFQFLSKSNEGRRRNDVNPQYALINNATAMPPGAPDYTQHQRFFGAAPISPVQLANMEWWFMLAGRGELDASNQASQIQTGKWGEANLLSDTLKAGPGTWRNPYAHARAGQTGSDEAAGVADGLRGSSFRDVNGQLFPPAVVFPAPRHPEDNQGQGTFVQNDGKTPLFVTNVMGLGRVRLSGYANYWLPAGNAATGPGPIWAYALTATFPTTTHLVAAAAVGTGLMDGNGYLVDDPGETMLDAELARDQVTDSIFGADEAAALHMADGDRTDNGIISRLIKLAPANFEKASDARDRRRRVTTVSSDLKAYAYTNPDPAGSRAWEVEPIDPANPNAPTFPPRVFPLTGGQFSIFEPFRAEARGLLAALPNLTSAPASRTVLKQLTRKLSVNHVATSYLGRDGEPRYLLRPVTPHPPGLPATALPSPVVRSTAGGTVLTVGVDRAAFGFDDRYLSVNNLATTDIAKQPTAIAQAQLQEWHARRDRQNLARDIYTLLYMFGDPVGTNAKTTNPYTIPQMVEMAQFAVNVVDAMDPDDTITCFVFDLDPTSSAPAGQQGYTLYDDGYSNPVTILADRDTNVDEDGDGDPANDLHHYLDTTTGITGGRGMVYGVESQHLAFGEAMAIFAKRFEEGMPLQATDYGATDWDDANHFDFTYVELQNMTATPLSLGGGWSVVCQASTTTTVPGPNPGDPPVSTDTNQVGRAVTLNDPGALIAPGVAYTVGTSGDGHNNVRDDSSLPSRTGWPPGTGAPVRPSNFSIDLEGSKDTDPGSFNEYDRIAPVSGPLDFDLMAREATPEQNTFRMTVVDSNDSSRDIQAFGSVDDNEQPVASGAAPKAGGWLNLGSRTDRNDLASGTVTFHLRRRLNLNRVAPARDTTNFPPVTYLDGPQDVTSVPARAEIERDNPWVIVDTIQVSLDVFNLTGTTTQAEMLARIDGVKSQHRAEPLRGTVAEMSSPHSAGAHIFNNLGEQSSGETTPPTMQYWQRHFDRPFASLADLLIVPLYGPREVTEANVAAKSIAVRDPRQTAAVNFLFPEGDRRPKVRDPMEMSPPPDDIPEDTLVPGALHRVNTKPGNAAGGNLWYRLFEFVEVPQKHGDNDGLPWFAHYGGPSQWLSDPGQRQPALREKLRLREFGKMNLNTMRHPHALAGLLDDPDVFGFQNDRPTGALTLPAPGGAGYLPAAEYGSPGMGKNTEIWIGIPPAPSPAPVNPIIARDWWMAMLASRDGGFDPYSTANIAGQKVILPGVPSAKPFMDFGSAPVASDSVSISADFQRTLLRTMPADDAVTTPTVIDLSTIETGAGGQVGGRRSLFELGNLGTYTLPPGDPNSAPGAGLLGSNAEFSTRYRLLGKVLNHATTRSNTYVAFVQCDFFEAIPAPKAPGATADGDHDNDDATPAVYQIGAKMPLDPADPDKARYRGVFVIDRSLALELLRRRDLPPSDQGLQYPQNSRYQTYSFAREPGPDQRPQPTFNWQDLIQYRRVVAQ